MIDFTTLTRGQMLRTRSGNSVEFITYIPHALPAQRVVCIHPEWRDITAFDDEGRFNPPEPSTLDIVGLA